MNTNYFELNLSTMTVLERIQYPQTFNGYLQIAFKVQAYGERQLSLTETEVLALTGLPDIKMVDEKLKLRFVNSVDETGNNTQKWYDTHANITVVPQDQYYSTLFAFKIRQINLMEMDEFLSFHLAKYHAADLTRYLRFLTLTLRSFTGQIIPMDYAVTVEEWMQEQKNATEGAEKPKSKIERKRDDNLTALNQEMTALLMAFLQKGRLILKDEYLNNTDTGAAFSILTGYSMETLRQKLGKAEELSTIKNLTELHNHFTRLTNLIEREIRERKQSGNKS